MKKNDIDNKIKYAFDVIYDMQKSGNFNPFDTLQGTETRQQKLYCVCVEYLHELENITETFENSLKKCL